ncbi:hypothetical protein Dsin_017844 [Dipteronia sinensis]|uniref:Uncharacterized protein n=1 Tax=Dipteronia sinensis TaxID=43782 RepID=A0AAE0AGF1_9ROSI|nr:hypothetical protein Dsin_017844 [Dipteronia sinensis]
MSVFYLSGTGFYVARIPERWRPGWFDLAGHSHQIFHVLVVLGALAHYGSTLMFLEWRDSVGCLNINIYVKVRKLTYIDFEVFLPAPSK